MNRAVAFYTGALIAGLLALIVVNRERAEKSRLEGVVESLRAQGDALERLQAENSRLSNLVFHSSGRSDQAPNELLRLRGEVGRLHLELANAQHQILDLEQEQNSNAVVRELAVTEVDVDALMNVPIGATTNDVLAELSRVGAQLVAHEPSFIEAGMSIPTTNGDLSPGVLLSFYFDGDKLLSKTYKRLPR